MPEGRATRRLAALKGSARARRGFPPGPRPRGLEPARGVPLHAPARVPRAGAPDRARGVRRAGAERRGPPVLRHGDHGALGRRRHPRVPRGHRMGVGHRPRGRAVLPGRLPRRAGVPRGCARAVFRPNGVRLVQREMLRRPPAAGAVLPGPDTFRDGTRHRPAAPGPAALAGHHGRLLAEDPRGEGARHPARHGHPRLRDPRGVLPVPAHGPPGGAARRVRPQPD